MEKKLGTVKYISPELFEGNVATYDPFQSDVWSLGVILCLMLTSSELYELPCYRDARFKYLVTGRLKEVFTVWGVELSDEAISLMEGMLQLNPSMRFTMDEVLDHPFVTKLVED